MTSTVPSCPYLRCLVIGRAASLVCWRFTQDYYMDEYDPTQGDGSHRKQKTLQDTLVLFEIDDVGTMGISSAYLNSLMEKKDILISIVEPTRPESIEALEKLRFGESRYLFDEKKKAGLLIEAVMVLWREQEMTSFSHATEQWKAGMEKGQQFAERAGAVGTYYCHAQTGRGINELFEKLGIMVLEQRAKRAEEAVRADYVVVQPHESTGERWDPHQDGEVNKKSPLRRLWRSIGERMHPQ